MESIKQHRHPERNSTLMVMSHYLGLRAKEMAKLKVRDVYDGEQVLGTLRLVAAYTKGGKHRDLSLGNKTVQTALADFIAYRKAVDKRRFTPDAPLFRSQRFNEFSPNEMAKLFIIIYKKAGVVKASSHSGRRSLIMKLDNNGVGLNLIRQIAGHKSISTTILYLDDNPSRQAEALLCI